MPGELQRDVAAGRRSWTEAMCQLPELFGEYATSNRKLLKAEGNYELSN